MIDCFDGGFVTAENRQPLAAPLTGLFCSKFFHPEAEWTDLVGRGASEQLGLPPIAPRRSGRVTAVCFWRGRHTYLPLCAFGPSDGISCGPGPARPGPRT